MMASSAKEKLLVDVVANDTAMIHEAYLAGEESEESKNARKEKRCRCILTGLLIYSLVNNALLAPGAFLYMANFLSPGSSSGSFPDGPTPAPGPTLNASCPFNNGTMDEKAVLALYRQSSTDFSVCWPKSSHKRYWGNPYTVLQDDWFDHGPLRTVFAGEETSYSSSGLVAGQPVQLQLQTWTSTSSSTDMHMEKSPIITIQMPEAGGCGNVPDLKLMRDQVKLDLPKKITACDTNPNDMFDHAKLVQCLKKSIGFSTSCANCYADNNGCIIDKCLKECMKGENPACTKCDNDNCLPAMMKCTALPRWVLDPSTVIVK